MPTSSQILRQKRAEEAWDARMAEARERARVEREKAAAERPVQVVTAAPGASGDAPVAAGAPAATAASKSPKKD